jgi:hypothetical protein
MENQERVTTLEWMIGEMTSIRRDGNTTRLIDNSIQIILTGKICVCIDHNDDRRSNEYLYKKIMRRLESEHPHHLKDIKTVFKNGYFEIWLTNIK